MLAERDLSQFTAGRPLTGPIASDRVQPFGFQSRPQGILRGPSNHLRPAVQPPLLPHERPQIEERPPHKQTRPFERPPLQILPTVPQIRSRREAEAQKETRPLSRPSIMPAPVNEVAVLPAVLPPHLQIQIEESEHPITKREANPQRQTRPFARPQRPQILPPVPQGRPQPLPAEIQGRPQVLPGSIRFRREAEAQKETRPLSRPSIMPAPVNEVAVLPAVLPPHLQIQVEEPQHPITKREANPQRQTRPFARPQQRPSVVPAGPVILPAPIQSRPQVLPGSIRFRREAEPQKQTKPLFRPGKPAVLPAPVGNAETLPIELPPHFQIQVEPQPLITKREADPQRNLRPAFRPHQQQPQILPPVPQGRPQTLPAPILPGRTLDLSLRQ